MEPSKEDGKTLSKAARWQRTSTHRMRFRREGRGGTEEPDLRRRPEGRLEVLVACGKTAASREKWGGSLAAEGLYSIEYGKGGRAPPVGEGRLRKSSKRAKKNQIALLLMPMPSPRFVIFLLFLDKR